MRLKTMLIQSLFAVIFCSLGTIGFSAQSYASAAMSDAVQENKVKEHVASLQMPFIQNQGQIEDSRVKFYANTFAGTAFVTDTGITYALPGTEEGKGWAIKEEFAGSKALTPTAVGDPAAPINCFIGNDQQKWRQNIPSYEEISLGDIYDHINIRLRAYGKNVEKIFTVDPGGDPAAISITVSGADKLCVSELGELELVTELGMVKMTRPVAYQEIDGRHIEVAVSYLVHENQYSFKLGDYNHAYPLVIDPLLAGTFLGVSGKTDSIASIKLFKESQEKQEKVYVTGKTLASNFPVTTGAAWVKSYDVFVTVLNSDLSGPLLASTLLGGDGSDSPSALAVNESGVYVAGKPGKGFPVLTGALQTTDSGNDAFITKLSHDLKTVHASTYFGGGAANDTINDLELDSSGNVYVTGLTQASNFPTTSGAHDTVAINGSNPQDAFVAKLNGDLSQLMVSTLLGGKGGSSTTSSYADEGKALHIDTEGNIYVTGWTKATDFETTTGAYQETSPLYGGVFVTKLKSDLSGPLLASTFIGQEGSNEYFSPQDMVMDSAGNVIIAGSIQCSSNWTFPITSGTYTSQTSGNIDVFLAKLNSSLTGMLASTQFGGSLGDILVSMGLDANGYIYLAGNTGSLDYPQTSGAFQPIIAGTTSNDCFISRLSPDLSSLDASTYLGGSAVDTFAGLAVSQDDGTVYVAGYTKSKNYPSTASSYQPAFSDTTNTDGFISKFSSDLSGANPYWPNGSALTASNVTNTSLTLTWSPAAYYTGVAYYKIYQGDTLIDTVSSEKTSYKVTGLNTETQYTFKVEAGSATEFWSTNGPTLSVKTTTVDTISPTWPENSTLTVSDVTENGLTLTWSAASDNNAVSSYKLFQGEQLLATVDGKTLTYKVTGLSAGTLCTFRVEAGDAFDNWSQTSNPSVTVTTGVHDDIAPYWPPGSSLRVGQ